MATVVVVIGVLTALTGLVGVISPDTMKQVGSRFRSRPGMYAAVAVRLVLGALLIWAGPACRPEVPWVGWTVRAIGALAVAVALGLLLLGQARYQSLIDWSLRQPPAFLRGTSLIAVALGVFLVYAGR